MIDTYCHIKWHIQDFLVEDPDILPIFSPRMTLRNPEIWSGGCSKKSTNDLGIRCGKYVVQEPFC